MWNALLLLGMLDLAITTQRATDGLVAHEWGTFTQVAGDDGVAIDWRPLVGPPELPDFVYAAGIRDPVVRRQRPPNFHGKSRARGTVRMETPVLYFYANKEMEASAKVAFPGGRITEWYPPVLDDENGIDWGHFMIMPHLNAPLLREARASHYYAARNTDSAMLRFCGGKTEYEKFLFYRGVGTFALPLEARLDGEVIHLRGAQGEALGRVIVFERRHGHAHFRLVDVPPGGVDVARPTGGAELDRQLEAWLLEQGLYYKEARAMIDTWRHDWFEDGLRVFYLLPRAATDEALPLEIEPRPQELVRVMVGRAEIITPETERAVLDSIGELQPYGNLDYDAITRRLQARYGRFAEPIFKRLVARARGAEERERIAFFARALANATRR
jgi:hypothetical protein